MSSIHVRTLACGMPLIVERMSGVASAGISWLLPAGFIVDDDAREGTSAMWEELLLRGTARMTSREHADAADRLGVTRDAELGTFTMRAGLVGLGERLSEALPLLVDMVRQPRMDAQAVDASRDLCVQAIEGLRDDPQERTLLLARQRHYPHPIGRTGMGTIAGLEACTRDQLALDWERCARPVGSVFAAAGAVDPDALAQRLDELLTGWSGTGPSVPIGPRPPRGYAHEHDTSEQVHIVLAHDAPAESHRDAVLEKLAVSVLSGGMSGRLFSEVREKRGLCYSVHASYRGDKDFGVVSAYVGTTPARAQESLDVLRAQLELINTPAGAVTSAEFERAKVGFKSGLVFSGESTIARAGALAQDWRRLGRPRSLAEIAGEIDAVTLDQLNAYLARRALGSITIQSLGPRELRSA